MEVVVKIGQFLLSLSILIVLHELGHFIPAKAFKTKVEKFYLFFDVKFSLFKKKIGDTVYGIGWLPLGGYVKIAGMIDESMDKEQMKQPAQPWEFRSKPAWQRLIIMLGGVIVNFVLAFIIYVFASFFYGDTDIDAKSLKYGYSITNPILNDLGLETGDQLIDIDGEEVTLYSEIGPSIIAADNITVEDKNGKLKKVTLPEDFLGQLSTSSNRSLFDLRVPFIVGKVPDSSANATSGLMPKDLFLSLNGEPFQFIDESKVLLNKYKGQTVEAQIKRGDDLLTKEVKITEAGKLEILLGGSFADAERLGYCKIVDKKYGFGESIAVGFTKFTHQISSYGAQLKKIFNPSTGAYKGVGGFKAIYDVFPAVWSWQAFWGLTAFLSIMLGVLNLLPIPALDGGHVVFLLFEMISGKKPSEKFLERAQVVGFVLLMTLVVFANGNDIFKAFSN